MPRSTLKNPYRPPVKAPSAPGVPAARFIAYVPVGGTSTTEPRTIGGGGPDYWDRLWSGTIAPSLAKGCKRFLIHNPGGVVLGKSMEWTQLIGAKNDGMSWIWDGIGPFIQKCVAAGAEPIAYVGNAVGDSILAPLESDFNAWCVNAVDALTPLLDAGASIAFDGAGGYWSTSAAYALLHLLHSAGTKVYVEPRAGRNPDGSELPQRAFASITEELFFRSIEASNPAWSVPIADITGEVVRLLSQPLPGKTWADRSWVMPAVQEIVDAGNTACAGATFLFDDTVKLQ